MSLLFSPLTLPSPRGGLLLPNRIVIAPMCQYSARDGLASDWHLMHWGNLLNSGAAMFTIEATAVLPEGRITPGCLGLWDERTEAAFTDTLHRARKLAPATAVCLQLAHAGRKASSAVPWEGGQLLAPAQGGWETFGPSAISQLPAEPPPTALSLGQLQQIRDAFASAARRARRAGVPGLFAGFERFRQAEKHDRVARSRRDLCFERKNVRARAECDCLVALGDRGCRRSTRSAPGRQAARSRRAQQA